MAITATTFGIDFDFTSAAQRTILQYLQDNNFMLLGYKGASGHNLLTVGVPTWFSVPFGNIFGQVTISYTPRYKVYVFNQATIAAYTTIEMQVLSSEIGLGNALAFNQDGSFGSVGNAPANSINLMNNRPSGTPNITVGLAGLIDLPTGQQYLPFCAFTLAPQGAISMTPIETIAIFAAQVSLVSGNVQGVASAPGSSFSFSNSVPDYELMVQPSTYQITNKPGSPLVNAVTAQQALVPLLSQTSP